jgi:tetratricopeptide (TPR) repeat protein
VDKAYDTFLKSSDLAIWSQCLVEFEARIRLQMSHGEPVSEDLRRGLLIAIYLTWLSTQSGDSDKEKHGQKVIDQFADAVCRLHARSPTPTTRRALGTLIAWRGYHRTAEAFLREQGELSPEIAPLILPVGEAKIAAFLRELALKPDQTRFAPVFYFYCNALVELGSVEEVKRLIDRPDQAAHDPLIRDLVGRIYEQSGRWAEAYELYRQSDWPAHEYRAAISRVIASAGDGTVAPEESWADGVLERTLARFETEISQSGLVRSSSFVNACRWTAFDSWLVHFELAKLNFRRRRYLAADAHFRVAFEKCPRTAQLPVASARFACLTWLSQTGGVRDLDMMPEALASGYAALEVSSERDQDGTSWIRTWLARNAFDLSLLQPVFEARDPYSRAQAFEMVGNRPEAIRYYLLAIEQSYSARAMQWLIGEFTSCGLAHTVGYLVELVLRESQDDFFALWELGLCLLPYRGRPEMAHAKLDEHLKLIASRIEELSRFEFQHLVRAYEFFLEAGRQDRAAAMLSRAIKLADSPEENVALAVAHRRLAGFAASDRAIQGLICLRRAEREAGERLERLEIARECGHYGQVQRARRILEEEGAFNPGNNFSAVEHIAVLQCAPWLTADELRDLSRNAFMAFLRDVMAGVIRDQGRFLKRLLDTVSAADQSLADTLRKGWVAATKVEKAGELSTTSNNGGGTPSEEPDMQEWDGESWKGWHDAMKARHNEGDLPGERELLTRMITILSEKPVQFRLAAWSFVYGVLNAEIASAAKVRPVVEDSRTPFSRSGKILDDWRAQEVTDLWRKYVASNTAAGDERALKEIKEFFAQEEHLIAEWEARRREEAAGPRRRAQYFSEAGVSILRLFLAQQSEHPFPVINGIHENLARDATMLLSRIERLRSQILDDRSAVDGAKR